MSDRTTTLPCEHEPFLDWYGIWAGSVGFNDDGTAWGSEVPKGVQLVLQEPALSEPLRIDGRETFEHGGGTVLHEAGVYRMWFSRSYAMDDWSSGALLYAESDDAMDWKTARVGLYEHDGSKNNGIVYPRAIPNGAVFRDPNGASGERYKLIDREHYARYRGEVHTGSKKVEQLVGELRREGFTDARISGTEARIGRMLSAAVSPDGLHWTKIEKPILEHSDGCGIARYDDFLEKYVGYVRIVLGGRRVIGRAETDDFWHWPQPSVVLQPDSQFPPTVDFYNPVYIPYPGDGYRLETGVDDRRGRFHLMFPSLYHRDTDTVDLYLAVSRDGMNWTWPERKPVLPLGPEGSGRGGMIYASSSLVELVGNQWALLVSMTDSLHEVKLPLEHQGYTMRWAGWQPDRLVALEAPVEGSVTLHERECRGETLELNFKTKPHGWIRIELIERAIYPAARVKPLAGFSFAECEPLRGDGSGESVRWNGSSSLAALRGKRLCVRVQLCQAKLFSFSL